MKNKTDRFIEKAMNTLHESAEPAAGRKEAVLQRVLEQGRAEAASPKWKRFVAEYPWRFALGVAVAQSAVCTLVFGSNYTNLVMQLIGR